MKELADFLAQKEGWLVNRVVDYAIKQQFAKYCSTLYEAWRLSIQGVTQAITEALMREGGPQELGPDENYEQDPIAAYGIMKARSHRNRGISIAMFVGLLKYYCQAYLDAVAEHEFKPAEKEQYILFIRRCFDRMEIGVFIELSKRTETELVCGLQCVNRQILNEKNKCLTTFESMLNPVFLFDVENRLINMNYSAERFFGQAGQPGANYYGEIHSDEITSWLSCELTEFQSSGRLEFAFEKEYRRDNWRAHFRVNMRKMLDLSEKFLGTVVVLDEITDYKNLERELKSKKDFAESLVLNSTVPTFLIDTNHKLVLWNKACEELTGFKAENVVGTDTFWRAFYKTRKHVLADYIIDGVPGEIDDLYDLLTPSGLVAGGLRAEGWFEDVRGKRRFLVVNAAPIHDDNGRMVAALETVQDLTYRKIVEEVLYENEQTFRATFSQAAAGIVHLSLDGDFLMFNQSMCEILGYGMEELVDMNVKDIVYPEDLAKHLEHVRNLVDEKTNSYQLEMRFIRKDDKLVWVKSSGSLIRDIEGRPKYVLSLVDDITERKLIQDRMAEKNRRMQAELELAASVQARFLPQELPEIPGIEFAWEFKPSIFVAGDMLNIIRIDENKVCFYILDVMGHGVVAAQKALIVSFLLKPSLNNQCELDKPSSVLTMLNNQFAGDFNDGRFFTIHLGCINRPTLEMTYSSAGHCPSILVKPDGETRELTFRNPAIGLAPDVVYNDKVVQLTPGDKVIMYTDGVVEARNVEGSFYSKDRLIDFISRNRHEPISDLIPDILQNVKTFAGHKQLADDLTVLGFEMLPE